MVSLFVDYSNVLVLSICVYIVLNSYKMKIEVSFTPAEREAILKSITIICDTREQENGHIIKWFEAKKIPYIKRKLDFGDYSFFIPKGVISDQKFTFVNNIAIERKNSLDELAGNIGKGRTNFAHEFNSAKVQGAKMFLFIEDCALVDIHGHNYQSQYKPKSFLGTLRAWESRYDLRIKFVDRDIMGKEIYIHFYYYLREYLLHG